MALTAEIAALVQRAEVVEEGMGDGMDEEGGVQRVLERLREMEGAQGIVVSAILEVYPPHSFELFFSPLLVLRIPLFTFPHYPSMSSFCSPCILFP